MSRRAVCICLACALAVIGAGMVAYYLLSRQRPRAEACSIAGGPARIWPEYAGTVIPPNIAPLNFVLSEPGRRCFVEISSANGKPIEIFSRNRKITIPARPWRQLLRANRGQELRFDIYLQATDGRWTKFEPIVNTIAKEDIDSHLVYRLIAPVYNVWKDMGIYQRNLENFDQSVVLHNRSFGGGCVNCHTFLRNGPANMLINVRPGPSGRPTGGMVLVRDAGPASVVNTRTDFNPIPAIYLAWHPSGQAVAFSSNKITQFFHSTGENRDVFDHRSDLGLYRLATNTVTSSPEISKPDRMETYPTWSPDGKSLYFCSAPQLPISQYQQVRYDLMRISYDLDSDTWGEAQMVLASDQTQLSITHPRISPDGRFLLFSMCKYGCFSIYRPDSDLYMMDLQTGQYKPLEINSDQSESWHCWSSNGRWIVFSSKRHDGLFARPYFSYVDTAGEAHRPILLPQADPTFYDSFIKTYNVPEFVTGPVTVTERDLDSLLYSKEKQLNAVLDPRLKETQLPRPDSQDAQYVPGPGG